MNIITSGWPYIDIDAYAGGAAYARLLSLQGDEAQFVSTAIINDTITPSLRNIPVGLHTTAATTADDSFTIIDASNPEQFDKIVVADQIAGVIDHHTGFADYWRDRLGDKAMIEPVGAACTQIYECWKSTGMLHRLTPGLARLLAAGILDNTLNFQAVITTERDRAAYHELSAIGSLTDTWPEIYFNECQETVESHLLESLENDTNRFDHEKLPHSISQLVLWDASKLLRERSEELERYARKWGNDWIIDILSLKDGRLYVLAGASGRAKLQRLIAVEFQANIGYTERLWLRKEIVAKALS